MYYERYLSAKTMPLAIDSIISCPFLKYVYKFALVQKQASAGFPIVLPSESFLVQHLLKAFFISSRFRSSCCRVILFQACLNNIKRPFV